MRVRPDLLSSKNGCSCSLAAAAAAAPVFVRFVAAAVVALALSSSLLLRSRWGGGGEHTLGTVLGGGGDHHVVRDHTTTIATSTTAPSPQQPQPQPQRQQPQQRSCVWNFVPGEEQRQRQDGDDGHNDDSDGNDECYVMLRNNFQQWTSPPPPPPPPPPNPPLSSSSFDGAAGGGGGGGTTASSQAKPIVTFVFFGDSTMNRLASSVREIWKNAAMKNWTNATNTATAAVAADAADVTQNGPFGTVPTVMKRSNSCTVLRYMHLVPRGSYKKPRIWRLPNNENNPPSNNNSNSNNTKIETEQEQQPQSRQQAKLEGPINHGYENPYCTDCRTCHAFRFGYPAATKKEATRANHSSAPLLSAPSWPPSPSPPSPPPYFMEYLPVEFARDVELQTRQTDTTQETVGKYLSLSFASMPPPPPPPLPLDEDTDHTTATSAPPPPPSFDPSLPQPPRSTTTACVVNTGLHDQSIEPRMSEEQYLDNVYDYVRILDESGACPTLVWIATSATLNDPTRGQNNARISSWNDAVKDMLLVQRPTREEEEEEEEDLDINDLDVNGDANEKERPVRQRRPPPHRNAYYIDVYNTSLHTKHVDNLHLIMPYYNSLAKTVFWRFMN